MKNIFVKILNIKKSRITKYVINPSHLYKQIIFNKKVYKINLIK
jgi:hypothetical protein